MIVTPKQFSQSALTATTTTILYTVPASTDSIYKEIVLCNTDTVSRTVTIQTGDGTVVKNRILNTVSLLPNETQIYTFATALSTTETITGGASAGSVVSCTISGVEIT